MNYVIAVSGGVDSVVLLDMIIHKKLAITQNYNLRGSTFRTNDKMTVAHFDHGIRPDSAADARFVAALAARYGLAIETKREELGSTASEALARERRYAFLRDVAQRHEAELVTAHHLDDVVESITINLTRGTGWRGLAVLGDQSIHRPLLDHTKSDLYEYALAHSLEWVEDETNQRDIYLRNRLRRRIQPRLDRREKNELLVLRDIQLRLTEQIDSETKKMLGAGSVASSRYFFTMIDEPSALELLRGLTDRRLTRPQLLALWYGIKIARPGSVQQLGAGLSAHFARHEFIVKSDN